MIKRRGVGLGALFGLVIGVSSSLSCSGDRSPTTPTPPVDPTAPTFSAPIPIAIGHTIGAATYAPFDSVTGGQGQNVDGISCDGSIPIQHIHAHLTLIADGVQRAIPLGIGASGAEVISNFVVDARCFYWVHTHDASGIIHIESPNATQRNLGELFAIWGEPLSRSNVGGFTGAVTAYVDSTRYDGDLGSLGFVERQQITLIVGTVPPQLPVYALPSAF
ncbi:MAG: hypothetical protein ABI446_09925 [Gemmatimonadaceae bacterium]